MGARTLDQQILDGPEQLYISDDDDNGSDLDTDGESSGARFLLERGHRVPGHQNTPGVMPGHASGPQTGVKGVQEDKRQYDIFCEQQRSRRRAELLKIAAKGTLQNAYTCCDDNVTPSENDMADENGFDKELEEYRKKRMEELKRQYDIPQPTFGEVHHCFDAQEFLECIEERDERVVIVVHLDHDRVAACYELNQHLEVIAHKYKQTKFVRIHASKASTKFATEAGLPAILVYKGGELIGNYVEVCDHIGEEFAIEDVEDFFQSYNYL